MAIEKRSGTHKSRWAVAGLLFGGFAVAIIYLRRLMAPETRAELAAGFDPSSWMISSETKSAMESGSPVARPAPIAFIQVEDGVTHCPAEYPIKISRSGIYYLPGQGQYARTTPWFCYADEQSALTDGYRARK